MYIDQLMNAGQAMDWGMCRAHNNVTQLDAKAYARSMQACAAWASCLTIWQLQAVPVSYKLTYFDAPGLAETTRLCFAATGTPFEDIRLSNSEAFQACIFIFMTYVVLSASYRICSGN
jgi:hypothetical protein